MEWQKSTLTLVMGLLKFFLSANIPADKGYAAHCEINERAKE